MGESLVARVLRRIEQAEAHEVNPWYCDDYRISWIALLRASRGEPNTFVSASYTVLGLHPDKVWPSIVARRKALLGPLYDLWDLDLPPKKPPQSERLVKRRAAPGASIS